MTEIQAAESPNLLLEIENGNGDGQAMPRSHASAQSTVQLEEGEARSVPFHLNSDGIYDLLLIYSNDGPNTQDRIRVTIDSNQFETVVDDTRGSCDSGQGWNLFCQASVSPTSLLLRGGDHEIVFQVIEADSYGCELDAVALITPDAAVVSVSHIDALRLAIALAPPGSRIDIEAGVYIVDATIDVARDDIEIAGTGSGTVFELADGANCPAFVLGEPTPYLPTITHRDITLRDLTIDGRRLHQSSELCDDPGREHLRNNGVTLRQVSDCRVENVIVHSTASGGIVAELTCTGITISAVNAFDNRFDGIAWDGDLRESVIEDCDLHDNLAAGLSFDLGPAGNQISDCRMVRNGSLGAFIRDSERNHFLRCVFEGNGEDGVFIADGDASNAGARDNLFEACMFQANARYGVWQAGSRSTGNRVVGGSLRSNAAGQILESFPETAPLTLVDVEVE